ncbi:MAG: SDR family NAD(P)-dependent oxidoreductase, partial [Chloroflexota bacterium]
MKLPGKVIVVTGGGSGIGAASAKAFAAEGASVVMAGRTLSKVEVVAQQIIANGGQALAVACDVGRSADVEQMIATAVERYGRLDVLYNNAGISPSGA